MRKITRLSGIVAILLLSACQNQTSANQSGAAILNDKDSIPKGISPSQTRFEILSDHSFYFQGEGQNEIYFMARLVGGMDTVEKERSPLNISLVLDRSGSMSSESKLEKAKEAALLVLNNLNQDDQLSIVTYDDEVNLVKASGQVEYKTALENKVRQIQSGGSTNLSGGMLEGYNQVKSTQTEKAVNRVLLLSDGLANQGITDLIELQKIVRQKFDLDKVAISTFGIGSDFHEDLMTNLAEYGRGNYYFIDSPDQIPNIFKDELTGLLSVVAQNATLKLNFPSNQLELEKVFGYEASINGNEINIPFNDVFAEEEKVVLIKFRLKAGVSETLNFSSELQYDDVLNSYERKNEKLQLKIEPTSDKVAYEESANDDVLKNIVAFNAIDRFEEAARLIDEGRYEEARKMMEQNLKFMKSNAYYDSSQDSVLLEQLKSYEEYSESLEEVEEMEDSDLKIMQKSNKMRNYQYKKKKVKK